MPRQISFWSWRPKRSLPQDKTPLVRRVIPKTESMRPMCQIWNILSMLDVPFTKQKTLFKKYNAFYIRYANQLGEHIVWIKIVCFSTLLKPAIIHLFPRIFPFFLITSDVSANVFEQNRFSHFKGKTNKSRTTQEITLWLRKHMRWRPF